MPGWPRVVMIGSTIHGHVQLPEESVSLSRTTPVPKSLRALKLLSLFVVAPVVGLLAACTDLSETPASSIAPENFFKNADEVQGGLASVYSIGATRSSFGPAYF